MVLCCGRKRKLKREDSFSCVLESARLREIPGDKDLNHMDQSVESSFRLEEVQGEKDLNQMDLSVESVDRISLLPDYVIHHILSLLRNVKDAVRTSILSKRWRSLWYSFSILILDERKFPAGIGHEDSIYKRESFRDYVINSLRTHLEKNLFIQKLVLHMTTFDLEDAPHLDHWLSIARAKNIKELDLTFGIKNSKRYTLPQAVFLSNTVTGLRLSGCQLETCNSIRLPHLRKLYLRKIHLVEHIVQNIVSSCHSIEDLRLIQCSGLKHFQVSNLFQLNRVDIHHCNQLKKVDLSAPNLHTFWYCGKRETPCKVNLEGCKSLRRLTLEHPQVTRDFCEDQISNFPLLEKLDLSVSNKMKYVMISHQQLQRIVMKACQKLAFILINAPNLLSFEYKGVVMPYIEICPFRITEAKLSVEPKVKRQEISHGDKLWFVAREFIKKFNPNEFQLVLHSDKNIVIHENLNNISLPPLPNLSFEIIKSSACIEDVLSGLLRTLHPGSLSIISPPGSKFPELVYEMIKNKDKDPICCKYNIPCNKCWQHFLKDVKFEDLVDVELEAGEDKGTSSTCIWYNWLKSSYAPLLCQIANARFYWNSHQHGVET